MGQYGVILCSGRGVMHYGLHLCFDARSEATIIGIWERLSQRVPSWMHLGGARPHVTLTECDLVDLDALRGRLNDVACDTGAFDLAFTRVDTFASDEGVVFMEPQASVALTDLRARVVQSLDAVVCENSAEAGSLDNRRSRCKRRRRLAPELGPTADGA